MKKARDSFYVALRDRLQVLNPARQVMIRGVWRPGVLVEENESFAAIVPDNVFVLRWTKTLADEQHALVRTNRHVRSSISRQGQCPRADWTAAVC